MSNVIKRSLQTTVFTTAVGMALAASPVVNAYTIHNDVMELAPRSLWSVSRATGTASAPAYCTLSKRYDKNIILTLAENTSQSMTFALDFQKDRFEPKSTYHIIFATDNGDSRSYELSPATEKAFVLRVKDDPEFYESLWNSQALTIAVNTENYRFNTADFTDGRSQMNGCLASLSPVEKVKKDAVSDLEKTAEVTTVPVQITEKLDLRGAADLPVESPLVSLGNAPSVQVEGFEVARLEDVSQGVSNAPSKMKDAPSVATPLLKAPSVPVQDLSEAAAHIEPQSGVSAAAVAPPATPVSVVPKVLGPTFFAEFERLRQENARLKERAQLNTVSAPSCPTSESDNISVSQQVYEQLKIEKNLLSEQVKALQAAQSVVEDGSVVSFEQDTVLRDMMARMDQLIGENATLKEQLDKKSEKLDEVKKALNIAEVKIHDFQEVKEQLVSLSVESSIMSKSFAALEVASGAVTPAGADDELGALQRRYEEQRREMERMAQDMEKERRAFSEERQRLEKLLFDPALTEKEQLNYLAKLEEELRIAKKTVAELQGDVMPKKGMLPSPAMVTSGDRLSMAEMSNEIQRLRGEIDRLRRLSDGPDVEKAEYSQKKVVASSPMPKPVAQPEETKIVEPELIQEDTPAPIEITETPMVANDNKPAGTVMSLLPEKIVEPAVVRTKPEDEFLLGLLKDADQSFQVTNEDDDTLFWVSGAVEGTLVHKDLQSTSFEETVNGMIGNLKDKCPAMLTIEPLLLRKGKTGNLYAYDADCGPTTIGLLFYAKDGEKLSAISYGAPTKTKEDLVEKRDKLMDALMGTLEG